MQSNPCYKAVVAILALFSIIQSSAMAVELISEPPLENQPNDVAAVNIVAENYWAAICSKDPESVYGLFDQTIFDGLSDDEVSAIKENWLRNYKMMATKQGDSYEVSSRLWDAKEVPGAAKGWHWPVAPIYQFQIQTFKKTDNGREFLYLITDLVTRKDGKFLIIRPVPNPETAKKLFRKKSN